MAIVLELVQRIFAVIKGDDDRNVFLKYLLILVELYLGHKE